MCLYALYTHREKRCAAVFLLLFIALVPGIFVKHRTLHTPNRSLVSHLHLSHLPALCFLCSMLIIGCSTTLTCFLQQTTIEIVFTKIVSTLFFFLRVGAEGERILSMLQTQHRAGCGARSHSPRS